MAKAKKKVVELKEGEKLGTSKVIALVDDHLWADIGEDEPIYVKATEIIPEGGKIVIDTNNMARNA